jgi:excinuclease ABC subunit B
MLHDINSIERMEIIRDLRLGEFDVIVGINLLREVLTCRSVSGCNNGCGQAGLFKKRNLPYTDHRQSSQKCEGTVIMYADTITDSCAGP